MSVTRGLDPRVHLLCEYTFAKRMDCRVKPGNDEREAYLNGKCSRRKMWMAAKTTAMMPA
jgi:hypothetical protein